MYDHAGGPNEYAFPYFNLPHTSTTQSPHLPNGSLSGTAQRRSCVHSRLAGSFEPLPHMTVPLSPLRPGPTISRPKPLDPSPSSRSAKRRTPCKLNKHNLTVCAGLCSPYSLMLDQAAPHRTFAEVNKLEVPTRKRRNKLVCGKCLR